MTTAVKSIHEWQGFTYQIGERGMYWVSERGTNPMPGACCFKSREDARKGIAALILARKIMNVGPDDPTPIGDAFWNLLELTRNTSN